MPPTFPTMKKGYAALYDSADIINAKEMNGYADKLLSNKERYLAVEQSLGVPWVMVAALHMRESSASFKGHLHNGDPLTGRTYHVPAGRPKTGNPPFSWEFSAADALRMKGLDTIKNYTLELMLFKSEGFNGWGYLSKGNSPYIWAGTDEYHGGKYVADHVYDPNAWDKQPGVAALIKTLALKDASAAAWANKREAANSKLPDDVRKQATERERKGVGAGAATTGIGAAGTAGTSTQVPAHEAPGTKVAGVLVGTIALSIGLGIMVVAGFLLYRKTKLLRERWAGVTA